MTITIYGRPGSRARRPLWVARELGLDVLNVEPGPGETKQAAYLAINPNGKVPALVDGGFVLFESFAESLYLAKRYGTAACIPIVSSRRPLSGSGASGDWASSSET